MKKFLLAILIAVSFAACGRDLTQRDWDGYFKTLENKGFSVISGNYDRMNNRVRIYGENKHGIVYVFYFHPNSDIPFSVQKSVSD